MSEETEPVFEGEEPPEGFTLEGEQSREKEAASGGVYDRPAAIEDADEIGDDEVDDADGVADDDDDDADDGGD